MGRTTEKVIIKNLFDIEKASSGLLMENQIRCVEIEALVDTGASYLCLPPSIIKELGLLYSHSLNVKTGNGSLILNIYSVARISIRERYVDMQVMESSDDNVPPLIGYLVLEALDWVVNPKTKEIMGNPANDGKWVMDMY